MNTLDTRRAPALMIGRSAPTTRPTRFDPRAALREPTAWERFLAWLV